MPLKYSTIFLLVSFSLGCSSYNRLNVAFKEGFLYEGVEVKLKDQKIGSVFNLISNKESILAQIKFNQDIKIPIGSQFILYEPLIGDPTIKIVLAENKTFFSSKDTITGIFKHAKLE
jgi:hypothetical protein